MVVSLRVYTTAVVVCNLSAVAPESTPPHSSSHIPPPCLIRSKSVSHLLLQYRIEFSSRISNHWKRGRLLLRNKATTFEDISQKAAGGIIHVSYFIRDYRTTNQPKISDQQPEASLSCLLTSSSSQFSNLKFPISVYINA